MNTVSISPKIRKETEYYDYVAMALQYWIDMLKFVRLSIRVSFPEKRGGRVKNLVTLFKYSYYSLIMFEFKLIMYVLNFQFILSFSPSYSLCHGCTAPYFLPHWSSASPKLNLLEITFSCKAFVFSLRFFIFCKLK